MRDSAIIYRSFYEAIKTLPKENQADLWGAICEFALNEKEVQLDGISSAIFTLIKPQLEANLKRFKNGKQPKNKQNGSKTEAKNKQDESKVEANNNNNNNVNNNIDTSLRSDSFEKFWEYYGKKGSKKVAKERFLKLLENDIEAIRKHLPAYLKATPERKYRKDAERYLSNRLWENGDIEELNQHSEEVGLPHNWFNIDLTPEQWKLVPKEHIQAKRNADTRRAMGV